MKQSPPKTKADVPESVAFAEYELEAIVLTGSCQELLPRGRRGAPPRGLELTLGDSRQLRRVDTLVMSNLGYFQLKAAPGVWRLGLAPGRGSELFGIVPGGGGDAAAAPLAAAAGGEGGGEGEGGGGGGLADGLTTFISSFSGRHLQLRVRKRPGKEAEQLLPADGAAGSAGSAAVAEAKKKRSKDNVINVFTVASGHMYERLQKIMMLSVIKRTKSR